MRADIHDGVTQREELRSGESLGKEVGEVVRRGNKWYPESVVLHALAHKEVTSFDVLHAGVVLRVVGDVDGSFVVDVELHTLSLLSCHIR